MVYSDVFICDIQKRHNRAVAIGYCDVSKNVAKCYSLVQKVLLTFYKTSVNNITFS